MQIEFYREELTMAVWTGTNAANAYYWQSSTSVSMSGLDGNDTLFGNSGNDTIRGDSGNDLIDGLSGDDYLWGGTGNDTILGNAGSDRVWGDAGNDSLLGNSGNDQLYGGLGNDTLDGNADNDLLYGFDGNDRLLGSAGNDQLYGENDSDTLIGGTGNDQLWGGTGNDSLNGDDGNDTLAGATSVSMNGEVDVLTGGAAADTFVLGDSSGVFYLGSSWAIIQDFSWQQGDQIQVRGSRSEYSLSSRYEPGAGSASVQDGLVMRGNDVIAVLVDRTDADLSLDFKFV
ncbi:calcium-binding protein [Kamptonema formosum]|uniref:calcium-binding protein n=1 Tax=Kamptonema formosum TaxID=331992 RepID=UPI000345932E|nr:calcium-binding protein [Oscillatoria sp. PCC 10802]